MNKKDTLSLFSLLPLMLALFWQGSSCHSNRTNNNSARNDNHTMNTNSTAPQGSGVKGTWGAQGISMEVSDNGAEIGYDCAHGSITEKIVLDAQGHFSVRGLHVKEHPGPIRLGEDQSGQPARYSGTVSGETMSLTVTLSESKETIGTYTLTHGKSGRIRRCG